MIFSEFLFNRKYLFFKNNTIRHYPHYRNYLTYPTFFARIFFSATRPFTIMLFDTIDSCRTCPENNPDNFYANNKSTCKKCILAKKSLGRKRVPRKIKPHLCNTCGEDNPDNFPARKKSICRVCHNVKYSGNKRAYYAKMTPEQKAEAYQKKIARNDANFFKHLHTTIVARTRNKPYDNELTVADIEELFEIQQGRCYLSGVTMEARTLQWNSVSVDRKNSALGYAKDNVGLCCAVFNRMKLDLEPYEFVALCKAVTDHNY